MASSGIDIVTDPASPVIVMVPPSWVESISTNWSPKLLDALQSKPGGRLHAVVAHAEQLAGLRLPQFTAIRPARAGRKAYLIALIKSSLTISPMGTHSFTSSSKLSMTVSIRDIAPGIA